MSSTIFFLKDDELIELQRAPYENEDLLQELLARYPTILGAAGGERLLLVQREFGVPEEEDGSDRWSLDHLFLNDKGIPILVEAKRSSDPRARREVVAQMLDYAAHGVANWSVDRIMRCFRESAGADADAILAEFIGGIGAEAFWRQVEANLRSGRIVIIFVADAISPTLRRIVEFLNEQMRPAEVLAIEVEQFVNPNGQRTLVPRLLGQTERSQAAKAVAEERPPISEQQWFEFLAVSKGDALAKKAREIADWLRSAGFFVGITDRQDSLFARITKSDGNFSFPFFIRRSSGRLDTSLQNLKFTSSFSSDEARAKLLAQMRSSFPSLVSTSKVTGWPAIPLESLDDVTWSRFKELALGVKQRIETAGA